MHLRISMSALRQVDGALCWGRFAFHGPNSLCQVHLPSLAMCLGVRDCREQLFRVCLFSAQMRNSASSRRRSMVSYRSSKTKPFFLYLELDLQNEGRSKKKFQTTRGTGRPPVTESCINFQQELYEKMCCVARSPLHTGGRAETGTAPGKDSQGLPLLRTHSQL